MKLSLLIPFYNEEKQIPITLAAVIPILEGIGMDFEIVMVDDGSRDMTWDVIRQAADRVAEDPGREHLPADLDRPSGGGRHPDEAAGKRATAADDP